MANTLKKIYSTHIDTLSKKEDKILGDLGIYIGGKAQVSIPSRPGYVYVRLRNSRSELVHAFNDKVAQRYDLPVELSYQEGKYVVLRRNETLFSDWEKEEPYLAKHAPSHIFDREGGEVGGDVVWTYPYQFMPHLVHPFNVPGATNVFIHSHPLWNGNIWIMAGNTGTSSFVPYKPITGASLVLVTLDKSTGNPHFFSTTGTFIPEDVTGSNSLLSYYPTPTSEYIPLSVVRLVSGTTTIGWDNIYDVRQFNAHLPLIQVNSFTDIDHLQFSGLSISSTGTVAYIQSSGGGGGSTGSFGQLIFDIEGMLETGTSMSQPYLITDPSTFSRAYLYAEALGVTGTTIVDIVNQNNVSIFTGTPLTLPYNSTGTWVSLIPFISSFVRGDILKINVLQKAKEVKNAKILISSGIGLGTSGLTVEEVDGSPSFVGVEKIQFPTGTITGGGGTVIYTPTVITPGLRWLGKQVASASAQLDFTSLITSEFDVYQFEFINIVPANDAVRLWMRLSTNNGSTFITGSYGHAQIRWRAGVTADGGVESGASQIDLSGDNMGNDANYSYNGYIKMYNPLSTTLYKIIEGQIHYFNGSNRIGVVLHGIYENTQDIDAVRFLMSAGNIASGEIHLYGLAKS